MRAPVVKPLQVILVLLIAATLGFFYWGYQLSKVPWMGLEFVPAEDRGIAVSAVAPNSPNVGIVQAGDVLVALITEQGPMALTATHLLTEPDVLSYDALDDFYRDQSRLYDELLTGRLEVELADGRVLSIEAEAISTPTQLPLPWLAHFIYGALGIALAGGLIAFRPKEKAAQILIISAVGYYFMNLGPAYYGGRELALPGDVFRLMSLANHIGGVIHIAMLAALLSIFPKRISRYPIVSMIALLALGSIIADTLQLGESARTTHYMPLAFGFALGLIFAVFQWRLSRNNVIDRASFKWILLAMFWATATATTLLVIPVLLGKAPWSEQYIAFASLLVTYAGLIAGVARYKLFALEMWWARTWIWVASALLVIVLDMSLVFLMGVNKVDSLVLSVIFASFVYFPLRQYLWELFVPRTLPTQDVLSELAGELVGVKRLDELGRVWDRALRSMFRPLVLEASDAAVDIPSVSSNGLRMKLPNPVGGVSVMEYPDGGGRLFVPADVNLAQALVHIGRTVAASVRARHEGASEERNRIRSALHDDIGAKLLTIVHSDKSEEDAELARSALTDLREIIASREQSPLELDELLRRARDEFEQRLGRAKIAQVWSQPTDLPARVIPGYRVANFSSVVRETVTNIIRHSGASTVTVEVDVTENSLIMVIGDDGLSAAIESWVSGSGVRNMKRRMQQIGGEISIVSPEGAGTVTTLTYYF